MSKLPTECAHDTLHFGSGDYYVFCHECGGQWGRISGSIDEYRFGQDGKIEVGCDPCLANKCQWPESEKLSMPRTITRRDGNV